MMDFMGSLKRGVDRASFELDRFLRANRVKSQIGSLKAQRDEEMRLIGQRVLELHQQGEPIHEDLRSRAERIAQIQAELAQRESELEAINREAAPEEPQEPFEATQPEAESCPSCGVPLPGDATFCPRCGVRLEDTRSGND